MIFARFGGVSLAPARVQERPGRLALALALALALLLGGCSAQPSINPVDWWHSLEGGAIAQARPPPPNADAPYPTLATMPPKPTPPNAAALQTVAGALATDRANARYAATVAPIPTLPPPAARPAPAPAPAPAQADDEQPSASLQAANAPPPPRATPPATAAPSPAPAPAPAAASAALAAPVTMPDIPPAPPLPPSLPGVSVPARTAPTLPPVAPPPKPVPPGPPGPPVGIAFPVGSPVLRPAAQASLKSLAQQRGARGIAITGLGEATRDDPAAQAAALPLALDRARAVAAVLGALGVPATALHIVALPSGGGAVARLVD